MVKGIDQLALETINAIEAIPSRRHQTVRRAQAQCIVAEALRRAVKEAEDAASSRADELKRTLWLVLRIGGVRVPKRIIEQFDQRRAVILTSVDPIDGSYSLSAGLAQEDVEQ